MPARSKNWLLTPHCGADGFAGKEDEWFKTTLMANAAVQAVCGQREICPTTGGEHMQIFVVLKERKREGWMIRHPLLGVACNVAVGDHKWKCMYNYCTQEYYPADHADHPGARKRMDGHDSFEDGEWPAQGKRSDILLMVDFAMEDKGISSFAEAAYATNGAVIRYPRAYEMLLDEQGTPRDPSVPHTAEWYYGEGRIGKSFLANSENPEAYRKTSGNRWWPRYKGQKTVIYDEFAGRKGQILHQGICLYLLFYL